MKEVVLVSGGLDSILVTAKHPHAARLFVNYGQPEAAREWIAASILWPDVQMISILGGELGREGTYFPARNLMLCSLAVMFAGADRVLLGGMKDDLCADKTPAAFADMSRILTAQAGRMIEVHSPFWNLNKSQAVAEYLRDGGDARRLSESFSCYAGGGEACGDCEACLRRSAALVANGVSGWALISRRMLLQYFHKLHNYDAARRATIVRLAQEQGYSVLNLDVDDNELADKARALMQVQNNLIVVSAVNVEANRSKVEQWLVQHEIPWHALLLETMEFDEVA